ncbi:MAG: superoxide dismutase, superoxide dismutase, Fe-Mn family [Candidatus Peregrinibacteria bacterium GW2011_GWF2_33_10]|nr:MAG: superoxide dismutase, superoxide dismutase, Fe-Mn family [Candidatus Peregrinibacteria bacterium GW2011_GWF2_33_10]OGJ44703.1 MAG: superoxide dismutase [Candidatus Peregrinibacteria bacterium RIFOXYA12_FULL_33_12]OGJ46220.1 MAG: superoxide dismutase [Candidatus Peregrinibacteria bacterium RIFOXYA2_FULL_33_21]OGJ51636.1 MAG: superoxide dismutase [Candidatus Peregrinibacteria bacterium RIFOXYB2_FULL_33_20]
MYTSQNFDHLLGLPGFSDQMLTNHFALYQGYVVNSNKNLELMKKTLDEGAMYEYAEVKRRFGWEFSGMRLHEYYFDNLTRESQPLAKSSVLYKQIVKDFGSYEVFEKDFRATGGMRGIGWVVMYLDKIANRLFNVWVNEHDLGHLSGAEPILVMDVFEHAYMLDYGLKKADYMDVFMNVVDFSKINNRFMAN